MEKDMLGNWLKSRELNQANSEDKYWDVDSGVESGMSTPTCEEDRYRFFPDIADKVDILDEKSILKNCQMEDALSSKEIIISSLQVKNQELQESIDILQTKV